MKKSKLKIYSKCYKRRNEDSEDSDLERSGSSSKISNYEEDNATSSRSSAFQPQQVQQQHQPPQANNPFKTAREQLSIDAVSKQNPGYNNNNSGYGNSYGGNNNSNSNSNLNYGAAKKSLGAK